jgi:hypothetical protein
MVYTGVYIIEPDTINLAEDNYIRGILRERDEN